MDSDPVMSAMAYVIMVVAALVFFYAHRQQMGGVLRLALTLAAAAAANLLAPVRPGESVAGANRITKV